MRGIVRLCALYTSLLVFGAGGCVRRHQSFQGTTAQRLPLAIAFPRNVRETEPLASLLYDALWEYCVLRGYDIESSDAENSGESAWRIVLDVRSLTHDDELVTPDVIMYAARAYVIVHCTIYNPVGLVVQERDIHAKGWVYKPLNPLMNREYLVYQYRRICNTLIGEVEWLVRQAQEQALSPEQKIVRI